MVHDDLLTTRQVSDLLGVEARQVRVLAERGAITRVARGIFDRASVERYRADRGSGRTRTWAERTAWAAIAELSGSGAVELGGSQRSRLRAALREVVDPSDLVVRLRDRARVTTWSGHRSVSERLRDQIITPGRRRLGLVESDTVVDGYVHIERLPDLVSRFHLIESATGSITLRATSMDLDVVEGLVACDTTLAAVDAATSLDPRKRGVGQQTLTDRLEGFREHARR